MKKMTSQSALESICEPWEGFDHYLYSFKK
jgi:hypothetical protein